jgi:hypothetical protein
VTVAVAVGTLVTAPKRGVTVAGGVLVGCSGGTDVFVGGTDVALTTVFVGVLVRVLVGVFVRVLVGVLVLVDVFVGVIVAVGVIVGDGVNVFVGVLRGVAVS